MDEQRRWQIAENGVIEIEEHIRSGCLDLAKMAFKLSASGLIPFADDRQMDRLRKLATALEIRDPFWSQLPDAELKAVEPSKFGFH